MPKRPNPDDESSQAVKKRVSEKDSKPKIREIRSQSSEKTLQLLYSGASKLYHDLEDNNTKEVVADANGNSCRFCPTPILVQPLEKCSYCDKRMCSHCSNFCFNCKANFCINCSFLTYDDNVSACYSCYK